MSFQNHQATFAAYIRNPEKNPLPTGAKPERMTMYRELFFNNIDGFLTANFPILHSLFAEKDWQNLVQDFFAEHVCHTPHFSEIPEEFLAYLQNERKNATDLPFMTELAHYEWVEMALSISDAESMQMPVENLTQIKLKLSPLACSLAYQFPVQKISSNFIPVTSEQPTFLVVYRNRKDVVQFLEITPLTFQLLQLLETQPEQFAETYLTQLADFTPTITLAVLKEKGFEILEDFVKRGVIVAV
ncbi:MAG: putative DNA-binding domain-containing protein [Methylococcales bacterium]|nr:putative DNA-binding domain-containing protein [Methylococcales bacterium]MDD5754200.1 putative DNA-binding domain-containing protein [Methylococcales bacterium]